MIELRLLGPPEVTVDGEEPPRALLWRKHLGLLVYLALAPDRRAGREQLAGLFWGDKPDEAARQSLAEGLRILRRSTDDGVEDAGAGFVRLADGAVETDTDAFAALAEEGEVRAAADLVRGELMEGFALPDAWEFEEWLANRRREWRTRAEEALLASGEEALAEGRPDAAHRLSQRALSLAPASNRACRVAMRSLCLAGDRGRALEAYEAFAGWLDENLGIEPDQATEALADRVRRQRRWKLPAKRAARPDRGAESRRAPLTGRGRELAELVDQWEAARAGRGARTVILAGDSGTGRSRLVQELLARVELDGATTALVRALPADRGKEGSVLDGFDRALHPETGTDDATLAAALAAADRETPLVLALDDAALADETSLAELCAATARYPDACALVVITTGRNPARPALERLQAALGRDVPGALVRLGPLDADAIRELVDWAVPEYEDAARDRLARRVGADTAGYPLLAVELLHAVAHGLEATGTPTAWPAEGRTLDQTRPGELSDTLVASVRVGFRVLTPDAQELLAAASVLEPPVPGDRLGRAADVESPGLEEALDELEWERWLVADARGYSFVARLVREIVARDLITPGRRQRILDAAEG
ncbi:MAG: BTAD domain-containing putative transcriptional regulator [Longimicrobiales bacterium]|nr:BTAD domain-containing putative transcriptional regulator [Longimicrobiales bacterium]